jgi:hypothetical protein
MWCGYAHAASWDTRNVDRDINRDRRLEYLARSVIQDDDPESAARYRDQILVIFAMVPSHPSDLKTSGIVSKRTAPLSLTSNKTWEVR